MEHKKLNLNKPLLSVRRRSRMAASERANGRRTNNAHPALPWLSPYRSEPKCVPVGKPGTVPFHWEQIPGIPKQEIKPQPQDCDSPPIAPKLPPARYPEAEQHDSLQVSPTAIDNKIQAVSIPYGGPLMDEDMKNFASRKETVEENNKGSESEYCDAAFFDALDRLSRTQSFFLNCSLSDLTGMDDLDVNANRSLSTDPQTPELMIGRLLPAAKAVGSKRPQHASNKQSVVREQLQQLKKISFADKPAVRHWPSFAKRISHYHNNEEKGSDKDCEHHGDLPAECGLLPQVCLKNSVCLANPLSRMSVRTRVPKSLGNKIEPKSTSSGSYAKSEDEQKHVIVELRQDGTVQKAELKEKISLKEETGQLDGCIALTCRDAPLSFLEEKANQNRGSGCRRKGSKTFRELLADEEGPNELVSAGSVAQKTEHVDTAQKVGCMRSRSVNALEAGVLDSREKEGRVKTKRMDQMHVMDSSLEDFKKLNAIDREAKLRSKAHKSGCFIAGSSTNESNRKFGKEMLNALRLNQAEKEDALNIEKRLPKLHTHGSSHEKHSDSPVAPPLPRSPSDSWLLRTLPSLSTKSACPRLCLGAATSAPSRSFRAPTGNIEWEAKLTSTKMQGQSIHCSEVTKVGHGASHAMHVHQSSASYGH